MNYEVITNILDRYQIELRQRQATCSITLRGEVESKIQAVEEIRLRLNEANWEGEQ